MSEWFGNYTWRNGVPAGVNKISVDLIGEQEWCFTILRDPYGKRYSVEGYYWGTFALVIYDSAHFNFKQLRSEFPASWRREVLKESRDQWITSIALVRDEDDRAICLERYVYSEGFCRSCYLSTPQGVPIGAQHMHYHHLGDDWNGVQLLDAAGREVLRKVYACDERGEFGKLLSEDFAPLTCR